MRTVWDIIKSPVITEKALMAKEDTQDGRQLLTFRVDRKATKPEIKNAVETIFQVKVDQVRTAQYLARWPGAGALRVASLRGRKHLSLSSRARSRLITAKRSSYQLSVISF